jgi:hypothetical protein
MATEEAMNGAKLALTLFECRVAALILQPLKARTHLLKGCGGTLCTPPCESHAKNK